MEKIYNFAKKDFFILHLPMLQLFFWFFYVFFLYAGHLNVLNKIRLLQEIRDYASSMLGELDLQEQAIFNATRNLYSDRRFYVLIITVRAVHLLPYSMT